MWKNMSGWQGSWSGTTGWLTVPWVSAGFRSTPSYGPSYPHLSCASWSFCVPRSHPSMQPPCSPGVFVAAVPCCMLTLVCCQQWLAAFASTRGLTAGKAEKTQRGWEAGWAAKKAIMCYCHRGRRCRVWTCEGCPVRHRQAYRVSTHHVCVHDGIKKTEELFYMAEHYDTLISHKTTGSLLRAACTTFTKEWHDLIRNV